MTVHTLHRAALVPKRMPQLLPDNLDGLLSSRMASDNLASVADCLGRPHHAYVQRCYSERLTARIDLEDKA